MADDPRDFGLALTDPEQGHQQIVQAWQRAIRPRLEAGEQLWLEVQALEDSLSAAQRGYYWAVVLRDIADGVVVGGQRYTKDAWHEYGKREFLPRVKKKVRVAGRKRPVVTMVIGSTTGLSVRRMAEYLERWMAFAAEHGVTVSEPLPPHLRGLSRTKPKRTAAERADPITGELPEEEMTA